MIMITTAQILRTSINTRTSRLSPSMVCERMVQSIEEHNPAMPSAALDLAVAWYDYLWTLGHDLLYCLPYHPKNSMHSRKGLLDDHFLVSITPDLLARHASFEIVVLALWVIQHILHAIEPP